MGIDETIFGMVYRRVTRWFTAPGPGGVATLVAPEDLDALSVFACVLCGESVRVVPTAAHGGFAGDTLLIPDRVVAPYDASTAADVIVFSLLFSSLARAGNLVLEGGAEPAEALARSMAVAPQLHALALDAYPASAERLAAIEQLWALRSQGNSMVQNALAPFFPLLRFPPPVSRSAGLATHATDPKKPDEPKTLRETRARQNVRFIREMEISGQDNPAVHSFEKVHTLDEYLGGRKHIDGADELAAHADALDELDLENVARSSVQAQSIYRADVLFEGAAPDDDDGDPGGDAFVYDEFDVGAGQYRRQWCRLYPTLVEPLAPAAAQKRQTDAESRYGATIGALRSEFARIAAARRPQPRQLDGVEIDLDAVVDHLAAMKAVGSQNPRLYLSRLRHEPDLAVLVLLDLSLSTDAWVDDRRVIDVARDAVSVLAASTERVIEQVAVAGFYSRTRRDCRFVPFKGFGEEWAPGLSRIFAAEPAGYTRMGPAVRHAHMLLRKTTARKRLLLVIGDGMPTDFDRYEGRYGVADVRMAVREAVREQTHVFGLGIDPRARLPLAEMFGPGGYSLLRAPDALPDALGRLFVSLLR